MANTEQSHFQKGLGADEDMTEYFDAPAVVMDKCRALAQKMMGAIGRTVVFTGAGISTSAQIPDYRGPNGVWTLQERGEDVKRLFKLKSIADAVPSPAHELIARLVSDQIVSGVVSTNVDGLHLKSGVPHSKLAELHGNLFLERCTLCKKDYWRDFDVTAPNGCQKDHGTARLCDDCDTPLKDTIIHFGEPLCAQTFELAKSMSDGSQLALVLGTSLRVRPASTLPGMARQLVIVNLQKTPHDARADLVIRARTDLVAALVAKELGLPHTIPPGWEEEYVSLHKVSTKQGLEFSRKTLQSMKTPQLLAMKPKAKTEFLGLRNEAKVQICPETRTPIFLENCSDCTFAIGNNNVLKIVVLECKNVSLLVGGRVLTGVMEIINSQGVNVAIVKAVPTIQIDNSSVTLGLVNPGIFKGSRVICSGNSTLDMAKSNEVAPSRIEFVQDNKDVAEDLLDASLVQYMVHMDDDSENILCEMVVREGAGYATSQRMKDEADAKDARNAILIEKYLTKLIKKRDVSKATKRQAQTAVQHVVSDKRQSRRLCIGKAGARNNGATHGTTYPSSNNLLLLFKKTIWHGWRWRHIGAHYRH